MNNEKTYTITNDILVGMVQYGAVYCSNGDAAHTNDYPDDRDDIIKAIKEQGYREIGPDGDSFDEYADVLAKLDLFGAKTARIFAAGGYLFCPDALHD